MPLTAYPDLSAYIYGQITEPMLNVGWLGGDSSYPVGEVATEVRDRLVCLAKSPVNMTRGLHYCEFCDAQSPIVVSKSDDPECVAYLGAGEIHVRGENAVFAAPTLIVHYIDAHRYLPPSVFLEALDRPLPYFS